MAEVTKSDDKGKPATTQSDKVVEHYYVVQLSGNGFAIHSETDDKAGAHRVAKSINGSVLTLTKGE